MVFGFLKFTFLIISITGNESNFMFSKNSKKRSKSMEIPTQQKNKIVNDIDGDGDDDDDENGEGIKYYLKMVLCFKDLAFL